LAVVTAVVIGTEWTLIWCRQNHICATSSILNLHPLPNGRIMEPPMVTKVKVKIHTISLRRPRTRKTGHDWRPLEDIRSGQRSFILYSPVNFRCGLCDRL